ncbi:MAG TPA: hypothetical protein VFE47_28805 [Tepidisphaeraceae bacterium]|nr:hypothetical protein [Tepidisphaeraceae bacterium]
MAQASRAAGPAATEPAANAWLTRARAEAAGISSIHDRYDILRRIGKLYADAGDEANARAGIGAIPFVSIPLVHWRTDYNGTLRAIAKLSDVHERNSAYATFSDRLLTINDTLHSISAADAITVPQLQEMAYMHICKFYADHGDFKSSGIMADRVPDRIRQRYCYDRLILLEIMQDKPKDLRQAAGRYHIDDVQFIVLVNERAKHEFEVGHLQAADDLAQYLAGPGGDWKVDLDRRQAEAAWKRGDKRAYSQFMAKAIAAVPKALAVEKCRWDIYVTRAQCGEADRVIAEITAGQPLATFVPGEHVPESDWRDILLAGGHVEEAIQFVTAKKDTFLFEGCARHLTATGNLARVERWLTDTHDATLRSYICFGVGSEQMAEREKMRE